MKKPLIFISSLLIISTLLFFGYSSWFTPKTIDKPIINIGRLICGGHLPLAIVEKKYQKDLKLFQINSVQNHNWDHVVADMKNGKLSGTFILSPLAMQLIKEGFPGKIVLKADRNGNGFVLSHKIKKISDLKNVTTVLAVPHIYSQHYVLLKILLKQNEIPDSMTTIVPMPPRDMILSLQRGEIDGFLVGEPEGLRAVSLDSGWLAAISPGIWKDHMDHVFMVTDQFIQDKPAQLAELIQYLIKAGQFIEENPHLAAVMGEDYTGAPAKIFEQVLNEPENWIDYSDMYPSDQDITSMAQKLVDIGLWTEIPPNIKQYTDTQFIKIKL